AEYSDSTQHVRRSGTGEISLSFIRCVASGQVFPRYCNCFGFDVVHGEGRKPGHWIPAASILTARPPFAAIHGHRGCSYTPRSEEHTSELQSRFDLVCRLLLEK